MQLGHDTQAVLLLTARFGVEDRKDAKPLGPKEWGDFAEWLKLQGVRPAELVNGRSTSLLADWSHPKITRERLDRLLQRGNAMALALEKWDRAGIWVLTRADERYPTRLKMRLGKTAPPVFFGCGNHELLDDGGLAVVGSRNASEADLEFCRQLGAKAAAGGYSVVSGGARGVDETAMLGALEFEGTVIGVMADSLMRAITRAAYRSALRSKDLVLISPYHPDTRFQVGNAMGRNKYIYCLADAGVIVTCEKERGGTFTGAKETLQNGWVPIWTRRAETSDEGVAALEAMGAIRIPAGEIRVASLFERQPAVETGPEKESEAPMKEKTENTHIESEAPEPYLKMGSEAPADPALALFNAFLKQLQPIIKEKPLKPVEISESLQLKPAQVKAWLEKAEENGWIELASKRPRTYRWATQGRLVLDSDCADKQT